MNPEELLSHSLLGMGLDRYAQHEERRMSGSEIPALLALLEEPFVSFKILRDTLDIWRGGICTENGGKPEEYFLSHAVVVGESASRAPTELSELLATSTREIMNPYISFHNGGYLTENGIIALKSGVKIREKMDRSSIPLDQWGVLLPGNIRFSDGTCAALDIDTGTGICVQGNLWLPPSWDQMRSAVLYDRRKRPEGRKYKSEIEVRPLCSTKNYTARLNFSSK